MAAPTGGRAARTWARYGAAIALLFAISLALGLTPTRLVGRTQALTDGWQYRWSDATSLAPLDEPWDAPGWTAHAMPRHPPRREGQVLWLRTRLPDGVYRDPTIAIDAVTGPFEAYLGTERVHVYPNPEGLAARTPSGLPWQLVSLPAAHTSAARAPVFALRVRADAGTSLVRGTPLYGERADHLAWAVQRDATRVACGLFVVLLGVAGFVALYRKDDNRVLLGFALWTVSTGLYVVHYTHAKDVVLDAPRFWFGLWLVLLPMLPLGGLVFLDAMFGSGPRGVLARLVRVQGVALPVALAAHAICLWVYARDPRAAAIVFGITTNLLRLLILVSLVASVVVVARRARAGDPEARIFLLALFVLFALASNDLLAAFGVARLSWKSLVHWGVLALALAQAAILQRRYTAALSRAAAFAAEVVVREREKANLLRDLHDGVGGLTSNIRVLAELGKKSDERAKRSLSTIAELSDRSLAQLRAFVQALDDTTSTWETLAADLRRFGGQLVTAAGIEFEMTTDLGADGPAAEPPRGLLAIHFLRVFQESITNALKRQVRRIAVSLRVDASSAELIVESSGSSVEDGGPSPRVGLDLGKGLGNMRARAAELGGTFAIEHEPGDGRPTRTRVRLLVPLPLRVPADLEIPPEPPSRA